MSFNLITVFITLFSIFSIGVISQSNYIYSVTTTLNPLTEYQNIYIYDVTNDLDFLNITVSTQYQLQSILSADQTSSIVFLGYQSENNQKVIVEFNIGTKTFTEQSSISDSIIASFKYVQQPVIQVAKSIYMTGQLNEQTVPSLLNWDFQSQQFNDELLYLPNYNSETLKTEPGYLAYSEDKDWFYLSFQSNKTTTGSASIIGFSRNYPDENNQVWYNINGLNTIDIKMLFIDNHGNLYAIKYSSEFIVDICQINFQTNNCDLKISIYLGYEYSTSTVHRYSPFFQSADNSKLVVLIDAEELSIAATIIDLSVWNSTQVFLTNQWDSNENGVYSYFAYI